MLSAANRLADITVAQSITCVEEPRLRARQMALLALEESAIFSHFSRILSGLVRGLVDRSSGLDHQVSMRLNMPAATALAKPIRPT